jgi:hypothetical protein
MCKGEQTILLSEAYVRTYEDLLLKEITTRINKALASHDLVQVEDLTKQLYREKQRQDPKLGYDHEEFWVIRQTFRRRKANRRN